jgi:YfiH family protein
MGCKPLDIAGGDKLDGMPSDVLQIPEWVPYTWLRHGFSARRGGVSTVYGDRQAGELNLGFTPEDERQNVQQNRALLLAATDAPAVLATVRQVHGATVHVVRALPEADASVVDADALVTSTPGLTLGILTADCVPILLADTRLRVVSAVHAGWRGTAAHVVERAVDMMCREFGSQPKDLIAAIGPSIGPCCYSVGDALRPSFAGHLFEERCDGLYLDLWQANRDALLHSGVPASAITLRTDCTSCTNVDGKPRFFSHRSQHGRTGRMMAVIAIVNP